MADVSPLNDDALYQRIYLSAPSDRREKTDRFRFRKDRNLSLGVDYLLQCGCHDFLRLEDAALHDFLSRLSYTEHNKPCFPDFSQSDLRFPLAEDCSNQSGVFHSENFQLYFNLSHSETMALCAISDFEIGCDVEKEHDMNFELFLKHLSLDESAALQNCKTETEKKNLFFKIWTLKESFIKCTGDGLSCPLNSFSVLRGDFVSFSDSETKQNFCYALYHFSENDYHYAICVKENQKGGESVAPLRNDSIRIYRKTFS